MVIVRNQEQNTKYRIVINTFIKIFWRFSLIKDWPNKADDKSLFLNNHKKYLFHLSKNKKLLRFCFVRKIPRDKSNTKQRLAHERCYCASHHKPRNSNSLYLPRGLSKTIVKRLHGSTQCGSDQLRSISVISAPYMISAYQFHSAASGHLQTRGKFLTPIQVMSTLFAVAFVACLV